MRFHPRMLFRRMYSTNKYGPNFMGLDYMKKIKYCEIKKSIVVALVGFANAGKSTLINTMLGLKICASSKRPLTTVECQHVFYVKGDTQIILLDTPGILSSELKAKSDFVDSEYILKTKSIQKAQIVGVIVDVSCPYVKYDVRSHMKFLCNMFSADTEFVLVLNKVDLLKDKIELLKIAEKYYAAQFPIKVEVDTDQIKKQETRKFSQIFMISALKNDGVEQIIEYFRSVALEFSGAPPDSISDHPDSKIVEQTVRAALLDCVRKEIPYKCTIEVEYMEENSLGHLHIVVLIKCPSIRCYSGVKKEIVRTHIERKSLNDLQTLLDKKIALKVLPLLDKKEKKKK